jgi:hypothetical protein
MGEPSPHILHLNKLLAPEFDEKLAENIRVIFVIAFLFIALSKLTVAVEKAVGLLALYAVGVTGSELIMVVPSVTSNENPCIL